MQKKVFIKTFGCQMNEYDSGKMADLLEAEENYIRTDNPEEADLILLNTCSVREKAQEKVFSDLGRFRKLGKNKSNLIIGVSGCVASQEGEALIKRAPYVNLVFGPQTLHRLPKMLHAFEKTGEAQIDISFPEIEKFDYLPPARVEAPVAYVSIMEGCSKYCSYCIVPYTRGAEVSRRFEDVLIEIAGLAQQGVKEITLLGQNVNAYRGEMEDGTIADFAMLHGRNTGYRTHPLRHQPSKRIHAAPDRRLRERPATGQPSLPAGPARLRPDTGSHETRIHGTRIQVHHPAAESHPARPSGFQ